MELIRLLESNSNWVFVAVAALLMSTLLIGLIFSKIEDITEHARSRKTNEKAINHSPVFTTQQLPLDEGLLQQTL